MVFDWKMQLYWQLPVFLQEIAISQYARRLGKLYFGPGYEQWRQTFKSWQNWSSSELEAYQSGQLQAVVELAATKVPYYRENWRDLGWRSVKSKADLHTLPLLEKQSIRMNERAFISEGQDLKSLWMDETSGSTGTALRIYWPKTMVPQWQALVEVLVRNVAGVAQDVPRTMMGGRRIVRGNSVSPPYWRFNRSWRQLYLSSTHVSRTTVHGYVEAIRKYGSEWITGYGSAIAALAESALEEGISPIPLRAVIVSGDTLLPGMRSSIEKFFQCKCFDSYGQCEGVCVTMECPQGRMHVIPAVGILEIVGQDGSPCQPGQVGEMVATSLLNNAMPLIRYRLGDYAAWAKDQNCSCGSCYPIIAELEGRTDDYIVTPTGRRIGRLAAFRSSPTIHSAQLVQDAPSHAYLLVRPGEGYRHHDAAVVRCDILSRVGQLDIDILEVSEIPRTPQGKTKLVVRLEERPEMRRVYEDVFKSKG